MRRQLLVSAAAFVLATSSPVLAQNAPSSGAPPPRIGNIYNWRDHQPTQQEVDDAEAAAGVRARSSESNPQVEKEVKELLKQTDELDRRSGEDRKGYPAGRQ